MMISIIKDKKTYYFLGILFLFVIWFLASSSYSNDYIVPSIDLTFKALTNLISDGYTYKILGYTLLRLVVTVGVCFILGIFLAVISNVSYRFKAFIRPTIVLLKTLPIAVVIILLLIIWGRENSPYFIVGVVVLPLIYEATLIGLENIDSDILNEVKMLSGVNSFVVRKVYLPLTFPYILTALIQSIGLGLKVLVMAEFIAQPRYSIGNELVFYKEIACQMEFVYAWSIILIIFVLIVEYLIQYLSKKMK